MRSSLLAHTILALAPACSSTRPAPSVPDPDLRDPKAEFEALRSLAGVWTACGAGATKTDPFEIRFLVLDAGDTVEAVLLGGASKDAVLTFRLDHDQITMIQRPSGGDSLLMRGEPSHVPVRVKMRMSGSWDSESASVEPGPAREISREPDPSTHMLSFKPAGPMQIDWPIQGRLVEVGLSFSSIPGHGVSLMWGLRGRLGHQRSVSIDQESARGRCTPCGPRRRAGDDSSLDDLARQEGLLRPALRSCSEGRRALIGRQPLSCRRCSSAR
jgi:hypothetical protein